MAGAGKSARKDDSASGYHSHKKRGHERRPVLYAGMLERRNLKVRCVVVDISTKGAKVRTLEPYTGSFRDCTLAIAGAGRIEADVVWHRGVELGLEFRERTDLSPNRPTSSVTEILSALNKRL